MKDISFTKHAKERFYNRFGGFPLYNAMKMIEQAEKVVTKERTYYITKTYTFVTIETLDMIKVITFHKN